MNSNEFTRAAEDEADRTARIFIGNNDAAYGYNIGFTTCAEWAWDYLAQQETDTADRVLAWAVQQYPSGTPLDQDRRMVAAETEAFLAGRTGRETSKLVLAAKYAGPVDPPVEYEPTDAEVTAAMTAYEGHPDRVSAWRAALSAAHDVRRNEDQ